MGLLRLLRSAISSIMLWYYGATSAPTQEHGYTTSYSPLERITQQTTLMHEPEKGQAAENLDYLQEVVEQSKHSGLYDHLETFLQDKYGAAPSERYRVGHDGLDDAIMAYTDTKDVIGVGPKFKEHSRDIADNYGIAPSLAAFLTYAHERAHMAQGSYSSTKEAELDADRTIEQFLLSEEREARAQGDPFAARQFANARAYQRERLYQVGNDAIAQYRDAA